MAQISFTESLKKEYEDLYNRMEIRLDKLPAVDQAVDGILQYKSRYQQVEQALKVPWFFTGAIHSMECNRSFSCHLHNGDSLNARTRQVPKGRPATGKPPFTWEQSATDALTMRGLDKVTDWSLAHLMYQLEGYNGWGYRKYHQHVYSPYLWSYANHYTKGKYVADGTWSETAVSQQPGAMVLIRRLEERREIPSFFAPAAANQPLFTYSNKELPHAAELQRFLNTFDGVSLLVDGKPGKRTSDAVKLLFGFPLQGTPE